MQRSDVSEQLPSRLSILGQAPRVATVRRFRQIQYSKPAIFVEQVVGLQAPGAGRKVEPVWSQGPRLANNGGCGLSIYDMGSFNSKT